MAEMADSNTIGRYTLKREEMAKPLHLQKIEQAMDVRPLINYVKQVYKTPVSEPDSSDSESEASVAEKTNGEKMYDGIATSKQERRSDKLRLYNFSQVARERLWLRDILVTDSEDSEDSENWSKEERIRHLLYYHQIRRKHQARYYGNPENTQYQYYGAGFLSNFDKFPEHQKTITGNRKRRRERFTTKRGRGRKSNKERPMEMDGDTEHLNEEERFLFNTMQTEEENENPGMAMGVPRGMRGRRKKQLQTKSPEVMAMRRRKIWMMMAKKELGKVQRAKTNNHKEQLTSCRRVAQYCMRHWRQKAMQSQKNMKDTIWRAKRLTREMQAYWKRYDRVERETRRRMEKEAEEQRKMDVELMEAKRQQRKLNFLITQTELYAHFMSKKLGAASQQEQLMILSQLDEDKNPRLAAVDDYDSESVKMKVKMNVSQAFRAEQQRTMQFDQSSNIDDRPDVKEGQTEDRPQPAMFQGNLKHYQLKGLNWIANLYDQGINGILADEMGLGKTVQSIAVLCHIAEKYGIWGPFLIISPASTLHNWQQEMSRFVPDFKLVPYWGSPQERKILRGFWEQKDMHTKEASFHVVITSYQLVIQDFKYFNRIKWQYMILDEAQAIKSTSSVRWKLLQAFSCRNRLLLSGTPIQNSMAELWALLHFIMPTLFDSHEEFNEWFSKDIESHAENKTCMDEKHLSRLHMILKPFMLRRIKKDVENELSDKIEVMVYCPLTTRQKLLYSAVKKKIRIEDLLQTGSTQSAQSVTTCLMNLVMQFRKVCNHPELFERREARWPLFMTSESYVIPKLVAEDGLLNVALPSIEHLTLNKFNVFVSEHIHRSLYADSGGNDFGNSFFAFLRLLKMSSMELEQMMHLGLIFLWTFSWWSQKQGDRRCHQLEWQEEPETKHISDLFFVYTGPLAPYRIRTSPVLKQLVFTGMTGRESCVHTHTKHIFHSMPETVEHRLLRSRKVWAAQQNAAKPSAEVTTETGNSAAAALKSQLSKSSTAAKQECTTNEDGSENTTEDAAARSKVPVLPEFPHVPRLPRVEECVATDVPAFLYYTSPKIQVRSKELFASSRAAAWRQVRHTQCGNADGAVMVWHGTPELAELAKANQTWFTPLPQGGLFACTPRFGWSNVIVPDKQSLVTDSGKLFVLDHLLKKLKEQGHRVLIYSQMTKMIDLLEEYMWHRKWTYMRLDGSSKISERRDMVADFQARTDIFVFLLSTRAGGLGINLTAADTVIFYDSDWNPTVDQQAMDRAHRLGQTKQVTVYRLICNGTIEERILQRAREKSEIQRMVISGETFKPDTLKPKEVVSLLLDDEEIELKYRQKQQERRMLEEGRAMYSAANKRRLPMAPPRDAVRIKTESGGDEWVSVDANPGSPTSGDNPQGGAGVEEIIGSSPIVVSRRPIRGSRRGRPRGPRRGGGLGRGRTDIPMGTGTLDSNQLGVATSTSLSASPSETSPSSSPNVSSNLPSADLMAPVAIGRGVITARRGPGRPRLKPTGPGNQGTRRIRRPRKPVRPLPVPLGRGVPSSSSASGLPPEMLVRTPDPPANSGPGFYCQVDYMPE